MCCSDPSSPNSICVFDSICRDPSYSEAVNEIAVVYRITSYGGITKDYERCSQLKPFSGELPLQDRIYQALSDCMKGRISPAALLLAYYVFSSTRKPDVRISSPIACIDEDCKYVEELFEIK